MPGVVSESYDCEWGTAANALEIADALDEVYAKVSVIVGNPKPLFILDLLAAEGMDVDMPSYHVSLKQWRIIRFALERAKESL